jgi:hypothetical protein
MNNFSKMEQKMQKIDKKIHSVYSVVIKDYNGAFCAYRHGCKAACCFPWSEDPRMAINKDETIAVTRWQK